jgi:tripartite-type tricarboxylate transporter receptor subunit TctC
VGSSPAEFKAQIMREVEQTKQIVKERNIKFE